MHVHLDEIDLRAVDKVLANQGKKGFRVTNYLKHCQTSAKHIALRNISLNYLDEHYIGKCCIC